MGLEQNDDGVLHEVFEHRKYSPFMRLIAGITIVGLFFLSVGGYFYLMHPEPKVRLSLADVQEFLPSDLNEPFSSHNPDDIKGVVGDTENVIKQIANKIVVDSCRRSDKVCYSKALFYFVRDEIQYVSDSAFYDSLANPLSTLKTGGADCEDVSVLLASLEKSIGNDVRLVFIPGHVYVQIKIPGYRKSWLNLEATCEQCGFNEVPTNNLMQKKRFVEI